MNCYPPVFKTLNGFYYFNIEDSSVIEINKDQYEFLFEHFDNADKKLFPINSGQIINPLSSNHDEHSIQRLSHPYAPFLKYFLERKLNSIILQLTQRCNFRCKYCIYSESTNKSQRTHSNLDMTFHTARKAVDFLWARSLDSEQVSIGFYGGEPLLAFPLIKKVVEYAKKVFKGKKLNFNITTNGTLFTREILSYFQANNIGIMISLDGPKEINDLNRVYPNGEGTFDDVMSKIDLISSDFSDLYNNLSISMVVDPSNDFDCVNSLVLKNESLAHINVSPSLIDTDYGYDLPWKVSEDYSWKVQYDSFLSFLSFWGRYSNTNITPIGKSLVERTIDNEKKIYRLSPLKAIDCPSGPCIPGKTRLLCDVRGNLFPCERVSETSPPMLIGDLESGFNINSIEKLLNFSQLTEDECKSCWAFRLCDQCCKKADVGKQELSYETKLSHCKNSLNSAYDTLIHNILLTTIPHHYSSQITWRKK